MSSTTNPQDETSTALGIEAGPIKCSSVERRRLLEELGIEGRVKFVGDAKKAGRQAKEGDHLEEQFEDDIRNETGFDDQAQAQERGRDE